MLIQSTVNKIIDVLNLDLEWYIVSNLALLKLIYCLLTLCRLFLNVSNTSPPSLLLLHHQAEKEEMVSRL